MYLVNGERSQSIDIADRGLHYGDGLFETLEIWQGRPLFLDRHLQRLEKGCRKLLIPPPDPLLLTAEALQFSASSERAVLKIIITRGAGGRGYRQPEQINPTRILGLYPYPQYPQHFQTDGVAVRFCRQRLANNPPLAGVKHLNRLEQILARAEWRDENIAEGLMSDENGNVIEGVMSNLFIVKTDKLYTPKLENCGVAGIVRAIVLELAAQNHIPLVESQLKKEALFQADEIFLTNSVIGLWPVRQLEESVFRVGRLTETLQNRFNTARIEGM